MKVWDTIAAISTPPGKGGVALLRVSGDRALEIAERVFHPAGGRKLSELPSRYAVFGKILAPVAEDGIWQDVDEGLATVFRAPASFTGENTVEISCHGGVLVTQTVLSALLAAGARMAEAGEFTRRAYLNGKLGLSVAEALGSLLEAESVQQMTLAHSGMSGRLEQRMREIYEELRRVLSSALACIDFPEEDLAEMSREDMAATVEQCGAALERLKDTYRTGHAIAEGIPTVLCGAPNVGKSSLYNRLVGHEAAIVTAVEGTTRDVLTEVITLGQVTLRLFDTAGLRETNDAVEKIGVERARHVRDTAELILAVFDVTRPMKEEEERELIWLRNRRAQGVAVIALYNKWDAVADGGADPFGVIRCVEAALPDGVPFSAKTGEGMAVLSERVGTLFVDEKIRLREDAIVANARQMAAVSRAREAVDRARESLQGGVPVDLCCVDLEYAMRELGQIDGREVDEDVVDQIFHHFCVGK